MAAPLPDDGLVEILAVGEVAGDARSVDVALVALDTAGKPMVDLRLTSRASRGSANGWKEISPGVYAFTFTPPHLSEPMDVNVAINGRTPDKRIANSSAMLPVLTPWPDEIEVVAVPDHLVLGQRTEASVQVTGGDAPASVRLAASQGRVEPVVALGGGIHRGRYVAATTPSPHVAIVGAGDGLATDNATDWVGIPVHVAKSLTVPAAADEHVVVRIGARDYGPVAGGPKGAVVPVEVPPGVSSGTLLRVRGSSVKEEPIDLGVTPGPQVGFLPLARQIPADRASAVRAVAVKPDGTLDPTAVVQIAASQGAVTDGKTEGGRATAIWTPAAVSAPTAIKLSATVDGSAAPAVVTDVTVVPDRPARVELSADTSSGKVALTARALDAAGNGLAGRTIECDAVGAKADAPMRDAGGGSYQATFTPVVGSAVQVRCRVRTPASANPLRTVALVPGRPTIRNDGVAEMPILVASVDAFGLPVANVDVSLAVEHGGGTMPATVRTDANGLAEVSYTAGIHPTAVRVVARAGRVSGGTSFLQVPDGVTPVVIPPTGTALHTKIQAAWTASSPLLTIGN
jgi:hypothetical protein